MNIFRDEHNDLKKDYRYARNICRLLQGQGFQAVFAGGVVRDMLLEVDYSDIDIATNCTYDRLLKILAFFNEAKIKEVGKAFGVVLITIDGYDFEIAQFRTDHNCDGRKPSSVQLCSMEEDAKRRDFTMNAVFYDPISEEFHDFVGGMEDIQNRKLKFVGNAEDRIKEDYFRILRYVRFICRTFTYDAQEKELVDSMSADLLKYVSVERIQIELMTKIFTEKNISVYLKHFPILMKTLFPEVVALENIEQDPRWHPEGSALTHTDIIFMHLVGNGASPRLLLAGLFHDTGKALTTEIKDGKISSHGHENVSEEITRRWMTFMKFSNDDIEYVCGLVKDHMKLHQRGMSKSTLRKLMAKPYFYDLLCLNCCDILASSNDFIVYDDYCARIEKIESSTLPDRLVTGKDLIDLGLKPSEQFGTILNFLFDAQLEGKFSTTEEGIQYLIENGKEFGIELFLMNGG